MIDESPGREKPSTHEGAPRDERARRLDSARMTLHAARHAARKLGRPTDDDTNPPALRRN